MLGPRPPLLRWLSQRSLQRHSAAYGLGIDGDLLELGFDIGRNVGLRPSAEVLHQEPLHRGDHGEIVDGSGKAVSLVGGNEVLDGLAVVAYRSHDLVAFADVYARIVLALHHHERRYDGFG